MRHIVREIKQFGQIAVANAMYAEGYSWSPANRRPTNIDSMVMGLPRCRLVRILSRLQGRLT